MQRKFENYVGSTGKRSQPHAALLLATYEFQHNFDTFVEFSAIRFFFVFAAMNRMGVFEKSMRYASDLPNFSRQPTFAPWCEAFAPQRESADEKADFCY